MNAWPYPFWIAHRGAGKLAPENTLAAFRLGASFGYRGFECDVKLSRDGVPFLLHDATLERTTSGHGLAADVDWATLAQLDAGGWHGPEHAGEPPASLDAVATFCIRGDHVLNIEIKPSPGRERETGAIVAQRAAELWQAQAVAPLVSSFQPAALQAAKEAAPWLPRALLLDALPDGWLDAATELACVAIVCDQRLYNQPLVGRLHAAGLRALTYTVNETGAARALAALGVDGIITDAVDRFSPAPPMQEAG